MNPNRAVFITLILIAIFFFSGCQKKVSIYDFNNLSVSSENSTATGKEMTFVYITDPERVQYNTFSIVKPKDWNETSYNSATIVYLPPGQALGNTFSEKFSMMVGFLSTNDTRTLRQITEEEVNKSKSSDPNLQVMEWDDNARLGQIDAIKLVLNTSILNRTLIVTQLRAIQGNRIYAFTSQCAENRCTHMNIFDEMAQSFEWKNP